MSKGGLRLECAWCHRLMSEDVQGPVSHGICPACRTEAEFHREQLDDFLERLSGSVVAVDAAGAVVGANPLAAVLVGSDVESIKGRLCGEAITCVYSDLPGGCGRTTHCTGCTIRRAFEHTAATGEPVRNEPAFSYSRTLHGPVWRRFVISTERLGPLVLVRIDGGEEDKSGRVWH